MTHVVYLRRIKRARIVTRTCAINARLPDTIVSGAIVCKVTKATETPDVSVSASVYTRPMISCVRIYVCAYLTAAQLLLRRPYVWSYARIALSRTCLRDNVAVRYACLPQPRMHLSASQEIIAAVYVSPLPVLSPFPARARANLIRLKSNSCTRLSRCEARSVLLLAPDYTAVQRRFAGAKIMEKRFREI